MKKFRVVLMTAAIVAAFGAAYATQQVTCIYFPQYHKVGNSYVFAGEFGYNYYCLGAAGICTYYRPSPFSPDYYPCRVGVYQSIP